MCGPIKGEMMNKLVYGVGINDVDYVVQKRETIGYVDGKRKQKLIWVCPSYSVWQHMLARCYSEKLTERHPTYEGCSVCGEWVYLSKFKTWMETQDYQNKQLDKDLLIQGNKIYSPDTCVFVSQRVNSFLTDRKNDRGEWSLGVYFNKQVGKFKAQCCNPFSGKQENLGYFSDPDEAHSAWKTRKHELACLLAEEETDDRIKLALTVRYL